jgi:hypothetical protein
VKPGLLLAPVYAADSRSSRVAPLSGKPVWRAPGRPTLFPATPLPLTERSPRPKERTDDPLPPRL